MTLRYDTTGIDPKRDSEFIETAPGFQVEKNQPVSWPAVAFVCLLTDCLSC